MAITAEEIVGDWDRFIDCGGSGTIECGACHGQKMDSMPALRRQ